MLTRFVCVVSSWYWFRYSHTSMTVCICLWVSVFGLLTRAYATCIPEWEETVSDLTTLIGNGIKKIRLSIGCLFQYRIRAKVAADALRYNAICTVNCHACEHWVFRRFPNRIFQIKPTTIDSYWIFYAIYFFVFCSPKHTFFVLSLIRNACYGQFSLVVMWQIKWIETDRKKRAEAGDYFLKKTTCHFHCFGGTVVFLFGFLA